MLVVIKHFVDNKLW